MLAKLKLLIRKILPENIKTIIHLKENEFSGYTYCGISSENAESFISGTWKLPPSFVCDDCFDTDDIEGAVFEISDDRDRF